MYLSKGEKGANCESVFNVADNFTFDPNAKEKKKKDNYYTCHSSVEKVSSLEDLGQIKLTPIILQKIIRN